MMKAFTLYFTMLLLVGCASTPIKHNDIVISEVTYRATPLEAIADELTAQIRRQNPDFEGIIFDMIPPIIHRSQGSSHHSKALDMLESQYLNSIHSDPTNTLVTFSIGETPLGGVLELLSDLLGLHIRQDERSIIIRFVPSVLRIKEYVIDTETVAILKSTRAENAGFSDQYLWDDRKMILVEDGSMLMLASDEEHSIFQNRLDEIEHNKTLDRTSG